MALSLSESAYGIIKEIVPVERDGKGGVRGMGDGRKASKAGCGAAGSAGYGGLRLRPRLDLPTVHWIRNKKYPSIPTYYCLELDVVRIRQKKYQRA